MVILVRQPSLFTVWISLPGDQPPNSPSRKHSWICAFLVASDRLQGATGTARWTCSVRYTSPTDVILNGFSWSKTGWKRFSKSKIGMLGQQKNALIPGYFLLNIQSTWHHCHCDVTVLSKSGGWYTSRWYCLESWYSSMKGHWISHKSDCLSWAVDLKLSSCHPITNLQRCFLSRPSLQDQGSALKNRWAEGYEICRTC